MLLPPLAHLLFPPPVPPDLDDHGAEEEGRGHAIHEPDGAEPHAGHATPTGPATGPERSGEEGVALVVALFFMLITFGLVFSGTVDLESRQRQVDLALRTYGQAQQFAEAGLVEAHDWFRRQQTQPVTGFAPVLDTTATPPIIDTDDPTIGIVREHPIGRGIWGRFEVRRLVPGSLSELEVQDVSAARGAPGTGTVWRLVSRAVVYDRRDSSVPYDVAPNRILAGAVVEAEIRRMTFAPPAQAALLVRRGDRVLVGPRGRITGAGGAGVAYPNGTGPISSSGQVTGSPAQASMGTWYDSTQAIFGVETETLRSMADFQVASPAEFPSPVPTNRLIFSDVPIVFTPTRPLRGTGIVYVKGDVVIQAGTNSVFNGILYVDGDLSIRAPAVINGTILVTGNVDLDGAGDWTELVFDDGVVQSLMVEIGQYRRSTAIYAHDYRGALKR